MAVDDGNNNQVVFLKNIGSTMYSYCFIFLSLWNFEIK